MMNLFNKPTVCYGSKSACARGGMNFISVAPHRAVSGRRKNLLCCALSGWLGLVGLVAVNAWGCSSDSDTSSRARAPQQGHRTNALMWLLRYNHRGLLGYLW